MASVDEVWNHSISLVFAQDVAPLVQNDIIMLLEHPHPDKLSQG